MVEKKEKTDLKEKKTDSSGEEKAAPAEKSETPGKMEKDPAQVVKSEAQAQAPAKADDKFQNALKCVLEMNPDERLNFGTELIKGLTLLEVSRWVKALEKEFGVSAQTLAPGTPVAGAGGAASAEQEAKTSFDVILSACGEKKIHVIKEVRAITGLGLREAKTLVEEAPKPVKEGVSEEEANELKAKLEAVGAKVEVK